MAKIVIALGGNALQSRDSAPTAEAQLEVVKQTAERIAELSAAGHQLAIVHGNGPQVGRIVLASETAKDVVPPMPFDVCGAMSQGYIGYHIQQALRYALARRGIDTPVVSLVTQVVVDRGDPAFQNPTKPIGAFYGKDEAEELARTKGYAMKEDAGRGYRRVVASPLPRRIVEIDAVRRLMDSTIPVTCGGGGIPVVRKDGKLYGTPAVIDKDFASAKLAELLDADMLVILTAVEKVAINFGKPDQKGLDTLTPDEARKYIDEKQFAPGSMLPKVQAAMSFAESKPGRVALITLLEKAAEGIEGKTGTRVQM